MMIQITEKSVNNEWNTTYYELETEKKSINIDYNSERGTVRVLVKNASHNAWRGSFGREFDSFQAAIDAYKSADVKEAIRTVQEDI